MNMHIANATPTARSAISEKAMIAAVNITAWSGRKLDRQVTDEVNRDHGASADAGRYNKALLSRDALAEINKVAGEARDDHYARTAPWFDNGSRILSAKGYLAYAAAMQKHKAKFDAAVASFSAGYSAYVDAAKARLNGMFKAEDYPDPSEIAARFSFGYSIMPMPDADDFRVDVGEAAAEAIRADIKARTDKAIGDAMGDVFKRVCDKVGHMATKLAETRENDKGDKLAAIFRDSLVENVRELAALLPSLNITNDPLLASVADRMTALCRYDAEALRDDASARAEIAKAAAAIVDDVSAYMA